MTTAAPQRVRLASLAAGLLVSLALGAGGCFNLPADDVTFVCDPQGSASCPDGYSCEADGCCHRDGSDVAASSGECRLGGTGTGGFPLPGTDSGTDADSGTGGDTGDTGTDGATTKG